jgi:iron complex outermembrane receptor protein
MTRFGSCPLAFLLLGAICATAQNAPSTPPASTKPAESSDVQTIDVVAPGEFRDEQSVKRPTLSEEAPGTGEIKSLSQLPSVNFQSADPFGTYEWASRISVRGFNQNQLGYTLDDVPLGDMYYYSWNGLNISRAIIAENLDRIVLSQGAGSLTTASTSNLGGAVQFYSSDPADTRGTILEQSFGSFNGYRTYARFDSGLLKGGLTKYTISGLAEFGDKWKGHGNTEQNTYQLNGKLVHIVGDSGILTVFGAYSDQRQVDYQDLNKVWVQKLGYNWDNYGVWATSIQAAWACDGVGSYPAPVNQLAANQDPCDAAYYAGSTQRRDTFGGITFEKTVSARFSYKVTAYGHHDQTRMEWFTPYTPTYYNYFSQPAKITPATVISPISVRGTEPYILRGGVLVSLVYVRGPHSLEGGFWYEDDQFNEARRFYPTSIASPIEALNRFAVNPFYTAWEYAFNTKVYHAHLQDLWKINNRMTFALGFKMVESRTDGELTAAVKSSQSYTPGSYAQGALTSGKPILPQFGGDVKAGKHGELFGDVSYNVRAYVAGGPGPANSPWGETQAVYNASTPSLRPETSWTEEAGYRWNSKGTSLQTSYFHVNYANRLLVNSVGNGITGAASQLANVGGVTTNGMDAAFTQQLGLGFTYYNAITWMKSAYDQNVSYFNSTTNQTAIYLTQGKIVVDTPEVLYKCALDWHQHKSGTFAHLGSDYMSTRYFTYTNDGSVPGGFRTELGAGYVRPKAGAFQDLKLQINASNLLNAQYYSVMGTNGFIASDPLSVSNNTLQVGTPRAVYGTFNVRF